MAIKVLPKTRLYSFDLVFFVFILYLVLSFFVFGESSVDNFTNRLSIIIVMPYLCGRLLGQKENLSLVGSLKFMFALYLLMISFEVLRNPALVTEMDRLRLFPIGGDISDQGVSTAYNIGLNFGSMWMVFFTLWYWKFGKKTADLRSHKLLGWLIVIPLLILILGSRSSLAALAVSAAFLGLRQKFSAKKIFRLLGLGIVFVGLGYFFIPESRMVLLHEAVFLPRLLGADDSVGQCVLSGDSITARATLLSEAFRLLGKALFLGIGAGNFGLQYCGSPEELASPHSIFAQIMVDLGLSGLFIFGMMIWLLFRRFADVIKIHAISDHHNLKIIFSLWLFVLVQIQISGNIYYDYQFFLLTGLFAGVLQNAQRVEQ
ncbi:MAG: hypothetical protein COT73_00435 [Bdellovibrio sp. CG10_big_fil_rev_8_21_14_0_10_47_8]|nr:MAG: hypothetical protein COT73_00435 [Bdellovibrio sp. CG10_big_fil_rev_8_21_14_0_10_47_8]